MFEHPLVEKFVRFIWTDNVPWPLTKFDCAISWWSKQGFTVRTPRASHLSFKFNQRARRAEGISTYDAAFMWTIREFRESITSFSIIQEDLRVRSNTGELVSGGCILHVLNKLCMRFDRLETDFRHSEPRRQARGNWGRTFSYLYGAPVWKIIKASSPAVAALNGLWCLIETALMAYKQG